MSFLLHAVSNTSIPELSKNACLSSVMTMMTVLTMIFGMLPLMFSSGTGANGNSSLGTGVVGGMAVGTVALLFVVPVFYIIFEYLQEKIRKPMEEEADVQVLLEKEKSEAERER